MAKARLARYFGFFLASDNSTERLGLKYFNSFKSYRPVPYRKLQIPRRTHHDAIEAHLGPPVRNETARDHAGIVSDGVAHVKLIPEPHFMVPDEAGIDLHQRRPAPIRPVKQEPAPVNGTFVARDEIYQCRNCHREWTLLEVVGLAERVTTIAE